MLLKQTNTLMKRYGEKLINGTISDRELKTLMDLKSFPKSKGFVDINQPITDKNHRKSDAINDFVLAIAPRLTLATLHQLTARMINLAPDAGRNTFMRNEGLEKVFLAYELAQFPQSAAIFFLKPESLESIESAGSAKYEEFQARNRMQKEFSGTDDIKNLKDVILKPIIELYSKEDVAQRNVAYHYRHAIYNEAGGRFHAYKVSGTKFAGLPEHLQKFRGDHLKSQILLDFKMQLMDAKTHQEVDDLVTEFQKKVEYDVLTTGQGFISLRFHRPTSSLRAFEHMVNERKQDISTEKSIKLGMS